MSAEQLFFQHAKEDWFRASLSLKQRDSAGREFPRSIIGVLGETIAEAGASGLRTLAYRRQRKGAVTTQSPEIEEATEADVMTNFSAIVLGTTLIMIEELLITKGYSPTFHLNLLNGNLVGTVYGSYSYERSLRSEIINTGHYLQLCEAARRDPTLAIFFTRKGYQLLPKSLKHFLTAPGPDNRRNFRSHIEVLLLQYKKLAGEFITPYQRSPLPKSVYRDARQPDETESFTKLFRNEVRNWAYKKLKPWKYPHR